MFLFILFGMSAVFYNDVLALVSVLGSLLLFLGSPPNSPFRPLSGLAEWSSAPLVFGAFFQVCLLLTGLAREYETIGFVVLLPQGWVNALFALSLGLANLYWPGCVSFTRTTSSLPFTSISLSKPMPGA
jgi:hypothetical protein